MEQEKREEYRSSPFAKLEYEEWRRSLHPSASQATLSRRNAVAALLLLAASLALLALYVILVAL